MKELLQEVIQQSKFQVSIFDDRLLLEGRILSPAEAQAAGLASGLIAASMANPTEIKEIQSMKEDIEEQQDMEKLFRIAQKIRPESLIAIGEGQDRIICKVIKRASSDGGSTWQNIHIVLGVDQQSAEANRLWVGMLSEEDRKLILDNCMDGHQKALEKIRGSV
jgi:enoyl-CoA hydratase/carnithine racemase